MVAVAVDGPLGKHHVGALRLQNFAEFVEVVGIEHGVTVHLPGIQRASLEDFASFAGLGHADVGRRSPLRRRATHRYLSRAEPLRGQGRCNARRCRHNRTPGRRDARPQR